MAPLAASDLGYQCRSLLLWASVDNKSSGPSSTSLLCFLISESSAGKGAPAQWRKEKPVLWLLGTWSHVTRRTNYWMQQEPSARNTDRSQREDDMADCIRDTEMGSLGRRRQAMVRKCKGYNIHTSCTCINTYASIRPHFRYVKPSLAMQLSARPTFTNTRCPAYCSPQKPEYGS